MFSKDVKKQISTLMTGDLEGIIADDLIRIALLDECEKRYQQWEQRVQENDVEGASRCYALYQAFSVLYRDLLGKG